MLIVLSGCRQSNFQYDQQIGVANIQGEKNEACLAIANPSIKPGSKLTLVAAGEEPMVGTATAAELLLRIVITATCPRLNSVTRGQRFIESAPTSSGRTAAMHLQFFNRQAQSRSVEKDRGRP
jgi:hypothetical protein